MGIVIRRARAGDESQIAEFAIRLVEQHVEYDPRRFSLFANVAGAAAFYRERITDPRSALIIAEVDDVKAGFAFVTYEERDYAEMLEAGGWLHDLYIETEFRSLGIGSKLLSEAISAAREMKAEKLVLTVAAKNSIARDFFERSGFRPTMMEMTLDLVNIL